MSEIISLVQSHSDLRRYVQVGSTVVSVFSFLFCFLEGISIRKTNQRLICLLSIFILISDFFLSYASLGGWSYSVIENMSVKIDQKP